MVTIEELKKFVPFNGSPKYKINRNGKIYNTEKGRSFECYCTNPSCHYPKTTEVVQYRYTLSLYSHSTDSIIPHYCTLAESSSVARSAMHINRNDEERIAING